MFKKSVLIFSTYRGHQQTEKGTIENWVDTYLNYFFTYHHHFNDSNVIYCSLVYLATI